MGAETGIAWTDHTFNPWHGCQRVSPGCENCYAEAFNKFRHGGAGPHWGPLAPRRFFGDAHWNEPRKWDKAAAKEGRRDRVFCASMADVFEDRRDLNEQRQRLWHLILDTPSLDWQVLTKRPENLRKFLPPDWLDQPRPNVWLGTTVEDQLRADERIPHLLRTPAAVRFLSCEPLLEPVGLKLQRFAVRAVGGYGVDWVIVGGESGAGARPMQVEWARSIVDQCKAASVAVFVKQMGARPQDAWPGQPKNFYALGLKDKKGGNPAEWPGGAAAWPREFPR